MINLAEFTYGVDSCITFNIIQVLVEKLVEEKSEEILVLIFKSCYLNLSLRKFTILFKIEIHVY